MAIAIAIAINELQVWSLLIGCWVGCGAYAAVIGMFRARDLLGPARGLSNWLSALLSVCILCLFGPIALILVLLHIHDKKGDDPDNEN